MTPTSGAEIEPGNAQRQPAKRRQQVAGRGADKIPQGIGPQIHVTRHQVQEQENRQQVLEAEESELAMRMPCSARWALDRTRLVISKLHQQRMQGHPQAGDQQPRAATIAGAKASGQPGRGAGGPPFSTGSDSVLRRLMIARASSQK